MYMILSAQPLLVPNPHLRRLVRKRKAELRKIYEALRQIAEDEKKRLKK